MSIVQPEAGDKSTKRKAIPKRVRFEVLRRDNSTCHYCRSTENPLTIDHVLPVVLGGTDDPSNLLTACVDCNAGKSSSTPDAATVAKVNDDAVRWAEAVRKAAMATLAGDDALRERIDAIGQYWNDLIPEYRRNQPRFRLPSDWRQTVAGLLASGLPDAMVLDSMDVAASRPNLDNVWRYVIGVANKKLAKLHEDAARLLAKDSTSESDGACPHHEACDCEAEAYGLGRRTGYDACFAEPEVAYATYQYCSLAGVTDGLAYALVSD